MKRTRTVGGTACDHSNHVDSRGTETDGSGHPAAERTSTAARDGGDDTHSHQKEKAVHDRSTSTQGQRFGVRARVVDTRVIGKPDQFDEDPMKYADWSFKLRSYLGAVDQRYQQELTTTEASSTARLNATLDSEGSALSTQMYHILVMTTARSRVGQVSQRQRERSVRGLEAVRDEVGVPSFERGVVGLLMNVLGYRFRDEIPSWRRSRELVHDYEKQSTKTADDDIKMGVTMLGMEDVRFKEHLIRNSVRITSWNQMREEILEITRTQQYIDSQPMPMQLGANPKSKGKGKDSKGKGKAKARTSRAKARARMQRTNRPRKQRATIRESAFTATSQAT